jgi:phosphate acetyltransferase
MSHSQVSLERLARVSDLFAVAGRLSPSTAVLSGGHRVEDLRLVESARDHGFVDRIILVGQKDRMAAAVKEAAIDLAPDDMIAADDDDRIAAATIELLKAGGVDIVLKSDIPAAVMNRHIRSLAVRPTVSLATIFDASAISGGRPMLLTDAGATADCDLQGMTDLVCNAVDVAQAVMGIERPRVAILSAFGEQVASLPSTRMWLELAGQPWQDAAVCGPLSFDLATDPASVAVHGMPILPGAEEVAGKADVLVCPGIDTTSVLYKMIAALAKYGEASMASVTVGFPVPYVALSPADTLETRLASIALCAVYARRRPQDFMNNS